MAALAGFVNFNPDKEIPPLKGKVIFITGGTAGIGKVCVKAFAKHEPEHIYFTGRNATAAKSLINEIIADHAGLSLTFIPMNLSSLVDVKSAASRFIHDRLDILICNGGVMDVPPAVSADGFEIHMAVNHLSHAMLVRQFLPVIQRTADLPASDVRILIVSSAGYELYPKEGIWWDKVKTPMAGLRESWARYAQSKLANLVYAAELARQYPKILSVSIHPGFVATNLIHNSTLLAKVFMYGRHWLRGNTTVSPERGSLNHLWTSAGVGRSQLINGAYYEPVGVLGKLDGLAKDGEFASKLWKWTEQVLDEISV